MQAYMHSRALTEVAYELKLLLKHLICTFLI